ncbi:DUF4249 domain-containing protein [Aureibaculum luteum]|uniref:DUF4249 domain-containing protein n=1 Tax=Aureibaculum luteum TaxID=1548456 RepID=UPI000E48D465|nr:DUF4249 domain-containing protein [Aureibaculum luteum]
MNRYLRIIIFLSAVLITACEDVIDVDVQTVPPRLTIEASLDWEKGTTGNEQTIKLSTSTPYFDITSNTGVNDATVKVTNDDSLDEFVFVNQNNGTYTSSSFVPVVNQSYTLEVLYNGERYSATETLTPVVDIAEVFQSNQGLGGLDNNALEVNVSFDDPVDINNYYLIKFKEQGDLLPRLDYTDDEFRDGNRIEVFYEKYKEADEDEFIPGDIVDINFFGISRDYYNYVKLLIIQSGGNGLFGQTPAIVKGNCINIDNTDNYAHGYFRLTQVVRTNYTFQ